MRKPNWEFKHHMSEEKMHHMLYRDDDMKVQQEIHTKYHRGVPGEADVSYWIDDDPKEYSTEEAMIEEWEKRQK